MNRISPLSLIFTIVLLDLVGFGIVIPLINLYGLHFGAGALELALLASAYSAMQFIFAPFWGTLSDRVGRRPILLISLCGSTISYVLFAFAQSYALLLLSRVLAGIFAANISAAQAYIADVTDQKNRAHGMGLIGAAFGIGFTLGPPIGGVSAHWYGMSAPGLIAAGFSGITLLLAWFYLPESLAAEHRAQVVRGFRSPLNSETWSSLKNRAALQRLIAVFFAATFAFAQFEQAFAPFLQKKFGFPTELTGYKAGVLLMWLGMIGVIVQGVLVKRLLNYSSETRLLIAGLLVQGASFAVIPWIAEYNDYFVYGCLIPLGGGIANPCLSALLSLEAGKHEQGRILGVAQGFSSLARVLGPAAALLLFYYSSSAPFYLGAVVLCAAAMLSAQIHHR